MSSGSYFTIYRKHVDKVASKETIDALKEEYFKSNKNGLFGPSSKSDDELRDDIPVIMDASFKSERDESDSKNNIFYDKDGITYEKLLDFHFISTFSCLKEEWRMNAYSFKEASRIVSKDEVEKILQAIKYVLGEKYDKHFEDVLSNEYVNLFGEEYSPFVNRFKKSKLPLYIDKEGHSYKVTRGDDGFEAEIADSDASAKWNMEHAKACLEAFIHAESHPWNNEELVLEYSAY